MAAFELQDTSGSVEPVTATCGPAPGDQQRVKDECIVAYKVYDSCRRQNCLTSRELGAAVYAHSGEFDGHHVTEGHPVIPPENATSVTTGKVRITSIQVLDKQMNQFKPGYWDVDIEFKMEYRLTFRAPGEEDREIDARSTFLMKTTLFGSIGSDLAIGTDMYGDDQEKSLFSSAPFVWVEAKAIGLSVKINRLPVPPMPGPVPPSAYAEISVTIGLFCILKLFRLVHLNVQSRGFCIPDECRDRKVDPCEYFEDMDFPMDIFSPPQKAEFNAGISENISKVRL